MPFLFKFIGAISKQYFLVIYFFLSFWATGYAQKFEVLGGLNYHNYYGYYNSYSASSSYEETREGRFGYNLGIALDLDNYENDGRPFPLRFVLQIQNCKASLESSFSQILIPSSDTYTEINRTLLGLSLYFFNIRIKKLPDFDFGIQYSRLLFESSKITTIYDNHLTTEEMGESQKNYLGFTGRIGYEWIIFKRLPVIPEYNIYMGAGDKSIRHSLNLGIGLNKRKYLGN